MSGKLNKTGKVFTPSLMLVLVMSAVVLASALFGRAVLDMPGMQLAKIIFWNIEYFFVFALSLEIYGHADILEGRGLWIVVSGYTLSFLCVMVSGSIAILNFWMIGVLLAAIYVHPFIGVTLQVILTVCYCLINEVSYEYFICYLTFGVLLILLSKFMDKILNLIFILLILVTSNIAFLILIHDFDMVTMESAGPEVVSTVFMVLLVFAIYKYKEKKTMEPEKAEKEQNEKKAPKAEKLPKVKSFDVDVQLLEELKSFSPVLYSHSEYISQLAFGAAELLNCNKEIARAGAIYHEIGRMKAGGKYVEEGVKILKKHKVPKEVIKVVEEHNINFKMPSTKEAVAVMMSDSIVSTLTYLRKNESKENYPVSKVVASVFAKRLEKGMFDKAKLTQDEINRLKEYFIEELEKSNL